MCYCLLRVYNRDNFILVLLANVHSKIEEETVVPMSMFWHLHCDPETHVDVALLLIGLLEYKILHLEGLVVHHFYSCFGI